MYIKEASAMPGAQDQNNNTLSIDDIISNQHRRLYLNKL